MLLNPEEFNPYYNPYILLSKYEDIIEGLTENLSSVVEFYDAIPDAKLDYAYASGKWTVKDILLHIIDTERIFVYRALRISRQDKTPMTGFEQDDYVVSGKAKDRSMDSLLNEYISVRKATIALFETFTDSQLKSIGVASDSPVSVRAIGYIITGHENHHNNIIKERYL